MPSYVPRSFELWRLAVYPCIAKVHGWRNNHLGSSVARRVDQRKRKYGWNTWTVHFWQPRLNGGLPLFWLPTHLPYISFQNLQIIVLLSIKNFLRHFWTLCKISDFGNSGTIAWHFRRDKIKRRTYKQMLMKTWRNLAKSGKSPNICEMMWTTASFDLGSVQQNFDLVRTFGILFFLSGASKGAPSGHDP